MEDGDRLIEEVESLEIDPAGFGHEAHVRLAFAYLTRFELFDALHRCRRALRRLAEHHGAPRKYHETVTCALVFLIHERMEAARTDERDRVRHSGSASRGASASGSGSAVAAGGPTWEDFARSNPDVLRWKGGAFFDFYSEEVLRSDLARRTFVLPHGRARLPGSDRVAMAGSAP